MIKPSNKPKINKENCLIKEDFLDMLQNAKCRDIKTVDSYSKAIYEYEKFTNFANFKDFNKQKAISFKEYFAGKVNHYGKAISKSHLQHTTSHVKEFFIYLSNKDGYKKHIKYDDAMYFNLSFKDRAKARATSYQESHSLDDILSTIYNMPSNTILEQRNKALLSLAILTSPRISALQTARIVSVKYFKEYNAYCFCQNPNLVETKFSKQINAYFVGNNQELYNNVLLWQKYLIEQGFNKKDYLFPSIKNSFNQQGLPTLQLSTDMIKSQSTIRDIFKKAFINNNLPYYKPHSFRHSLTRACLKHKNSALLLVNLASNMGQEKEQGVLLASYGASPEHERAEVLKGSGLLAFKAKEQ